MAKGGARPNAGRKKGHKASHTVQAEAYRQFIIEQVVKEKAPIVEAMIDKAKKGDVQAFKELNDRALGKAPQGVDVTSMGEKVAGIVYLPPRGAASGPLETK